jgi:hypothetical protein
MKLHIPFDWKQGKRFVIAFWKDFSAVLFFFATILLPLLSPDFRNYLRDTIAFWKSATLGQWVGSLFFVGLIAGMIAFLLGLIQHGISPFYFRASFRYGIIRIGKHIRQCLHDAQPQQKKIRSLWRKLAVSFVDAYSEGYTKLHDRGISSQQLLSSNFQIYAKCVASLLNSAQGRNATVRTLLRRPLHDWYNPFSVAIDAAKHGNFTTKPWEDYKYCVQGLRDFQTSKIKFKRLIGLPPCEASTNHEHSKSFCVYCTTNGALTVDEATRVSIPSNVELLEQLSAILASAHKDKKIHLVGSFTGTSPPQNWMELVAHFESEFHTGSGAHTSAEEADVGGVYFKYLNTVPEAFVRYEDFFLIESGDVKFGIALCVEEDLDTGGISILKPEAIAQLQTKFDEAWISGKNKLELKLSGKTLAHRIS